SPMRSRLVGFAFSGFIAALAGALLVFHQHAMGRSYFAPEESIRVFSMAVFGGLGSAAGVIAGAAYFTALDYFVELDRLRLLASGAGLLVALMIFPGGLSQLIFGLRGRLLRMAARGRGLIVPSLVADAQQSDHAAASAA